MVLATQLLIYAVIYEHGVNSANVKLAFAPLADVGSLAAQLKLILHYLCVLLVDIDIVVAHRRLMFCYLSAMLADIKSSVA